MNLNNNQLNVRGTGFIYGYYNYFNNKNLFISKFHSSVCLLSDKDKDKDLGKRIENLQVNNNIDKDIRLSKVEEESLKNGLSELKTGITDSDVSDEFSKLQEYVKNHPTEMSSFEEAFPNYGKNTNLIEPSESKSVFDITKMISKEIQDCVSSGTINTECINKINLSDMIKKVMSNESSALSNKQISEKVGIIVKEELTDKKIFERIGDITLRDIYEQYTKLNDKVPLIIKANYMEIGFSLVSYAVLLRAYKKLVHDRPIPSNLTVEELNVLKATRTFSRY